MESNFNKLKNKWNDIQPIILIATSGLYLVSLFAIIGNAFEHEKYLPEGKLTLNTLGYFLTIFSYPWLLSVFRFDTKFSRRSLKIMKGLSIGFTGFAALMWYTNAENSYLEAATVIIGYTTLVINFSEKNLEKRLEDTQGKENE